MSSGFGEPFKSSFSGNGGCVHVQFFGAGVMVWDSERPAERMYVRNASWEAFTKGVKNDEFDLPGGGPDAA